MSSNEALKDLAPSDIPSMEFNHDLFFGSVKKGMAGFSSADLWKIDVTDIDKLKVLDDLNVRIDGPKLDAHIRYLADSMKEVGYMMSEPLEVFLLDVEGNVDAKGNPIPVIYVSDGHCRLRALKLAISEGAKIQQISCVTLPSKGKSISDLVVGLVRHNSGKDLTPFEKAIVCKRLQSYGFAVKEIATKVGFTPEYVNLLLEAASAPLSIITMIQSGELALNTAVELLRKHGVKSVEVIKQGLAASKAAGKKGLVKSFVPGAGLAKVVKRQAEGLYEATKKVSEDPAFAQLSKDSQDMIKALLEGIAEKEKKANEKAQRAAEKANGTLDDSGEEPVGEIKE